MAQHTTRDRCAVCHLAYLTKVMHLNSTPICDAYVTKTHLTEKQNLYSLDLYFCGNCGLLQITNIISPEILYRDYLYETSSSMGLSDHFRRYSENVIKTFSAKGCLAIDIGCNDGTLLKYFLAREAKVVGIEPAMRLSNLVRAQGIPCYNDFFSYALAKKIRAEHGPASVVTANNVIANITDLDDFMQAVRTLLDDDGVFVLETGAGLDVMTNLMVDTVCHEHIYYFTVKPLLHLAQKHHMELIDVKSITSKGGSLHVVMKPKESARPVHPSVNERRKFEQDLGFEGVQIYQENTLKLESLRTELKQILENITKRGKTYAVYGAAAGVTNLMYYFDINEEVPYLVDDNPARHGLFSPGNHIPVVSPETMYDRKPDFMLILSWRYAKPIIDKHLQYLRQGGAFIVPLPRIQIVSESGTRLDDLCSP